MSVNNAAEVNESTEIVLSILRINKNIGKTYIIMDKLFWNGK